MKLRRIFLSGPIFGSPPRLVKNPLVKLASAVLAAAALASSLVKIAPAVLAGAALASSLVKIAPAVLAGAALASADGPLLVKVAGARRGSKREDRGLTPPARQDRENCFGVLVPLSANLAENRTISPSETILRNLGRRYSQQVGASREFPLVWLVEER